MGWSYQGIVGGEDYWEGARHRGHTSHRELKFTICIVKVGCYSEPSPTIRVTGKVGGAHTGSVYK